MKKIAIVFGAKIGDIVNMQPVCRVLKEKYPDSQLILVTWPQGKPAASLITEIDSVELFDNKQKSTFGFLKDCLNIRSKYKIDLAVVINDSFTYQLVAFMIGAKYIVGRHKKGPGFLLNKKYDLTKKVDNDVHITEDLLRAVEPLGINTDNTTISLKNDFKQSDIDYVDKLISESGYDKDKLIGLSPCTSLKTKDLIIDEAINFIKLVNEKTDYKVVLTGTKEASILAENIKKEGVSDFLDLSCKVNIEQFAILLKHFKKFVSCDTGSAHIAYAYNVPTLTLFVATCFAAWSSQNTELHKVFYRENREKLIASEFFAELNLT